MVTSVAPSDAGTPASVGSSAGSDALITERTSMTNVSASFSPMMSLRASAP